MALTAPQETFCQQFVANKGNATDAYMAAYPKSQRASATAHGARLVANGNVKARIACLIAAAAKNSGLTAEFALAQLRLAIEYRGDGWSQSAWVSALGLAFKHLGLLTEDRPHPDRATIRVSDLTPEQKRAIRDTIRLVRTAVGATA